jgi:hypothetical protein
MTDTARLRELAGKARTAAPGDWRIDEFLGCVIGDGGTPIAGRDVLNHIAAANPTAILSLLDELDASKARIAEVETTLKDKYEAAAALAREPADLGIPDE